MTTRVYLDPKRMDKRLRVERKTVTKDASGGMVTTWAVLATVWAGIKPKTGDKMSLTTAGGDAPKATHEIEMRYFEGLSPTVHRLRHVTRTTSTVYDIGHINDSYGQRVKMIVDATTGVSDG